MSSKINNFPESGEGLVGYELGIQNNDLVFYQQGGNLFSGGFSVDSVLMKGGASPMKSISIGYDESCGIFGKNLVVPPMWFLSPTDHATTFKKNNYEENLLEEDLHDKLLKISQLNERKKRTAKLSPKKINKKTKKNKLGV
jgi:hypothetical protein